MAKKYRKALRREISVGLFFFIPNNEKGKDKKQYEMILLQLDPRKKERVFKVRDTKRILKILSLLQVIWKQ
jgi:hypothetical protein